jgi:hypothetical protein
MRERVTYIVRKGRSEFDPKRIEVGKTSIAVSEIDAMKEHQITLPVSEIPADIWRVLRNCQQLHIRWSTAQTQDLVAPYVSRITPGLHVGFTPVQGRSAKRLCSLLRQTFGQRLKCDSVETAFTSPPLQSVQSASPASKQYFYYINSLQDFSIWIQKNVCGEDGIPCRLRARDLEKASSIDIDFDAMSQSMTLKTIWTRPNGDDGKWYETLSKGKNAGDTLEVGVLMNEPPEEEETLRYSGFITQVGKDRSPSLSTTHILTTVFLTIS